ncbi:molecular chaperone GrpE (heat shock protein) [Burkholderia ambifaria]|nr:hypothetical protein [Burkholderia ambifaria]MDR6503965.1 molecular chaperone GrpE (heat shock protein) [Burkholderia ambifaria]
MDAQISVQRAQRLDALSAASDGRSKTAQLLDVFDSVERAVRAGVIQDLAATGLEFTYQTFALTLKKSVANMESWLAPHGRHARKLARS